MQVGTMELAIEKARADLAKETAAIDAEMDRLKQDLARVQEAIRKASLPAVNTPERPDMVRNRL